MAQKPLAPLVVDLDATWEATVPLLDPDTGDPITNWSGWSAVCQVAETPRRPGEERDPEDVHHTWSTVDGNAFLESGQIRITVEPEESLEWTWRSGYWDIRLTDPEGRVARPISPFSRVAVRGATTLL